MDYVTKRPNPECCTTHGNERDELRKTDCEANGILPCQTGVFQDTSPVAGSAKDPKRV